MASKRVGDIYKITVDKDLYIGSTWDFNQRLQLHKSNSKTSDIKLYKVIRDNNNEFEMSLLYNYECYTDTELRMEERNCYDELKPNLNTNKPYVSQEEMKEYWKNYYIKNKETIEAKEKQRRDNSRYICGCGSSVINKSSQIKRHEQTQKHKNYLLDM
jgi:hypothetical protein